MPMIQDAVKLIKLLLIGPSKSGKTHYAALAANSGYRVIYIDGDVAAATLGRMASSGVLTPEAARRIFLFSVNDSQRVDGAYDPRMDTFMKLMTDTGTIRWNDSASRPYAVADGNECDLAILHRLRLDERSVLVIDSWTSLVQSTMYWKCAEAGVDPSDVERYERGLYAGLNNRLDSVLQLIRNAPCHVIVIAHPDEHEKYANPVGKKISDVREQDRTLESIRQIARSCSRKHAGKMPAYFTSVGWLGFNAGNVRTLDFRPLKDRDSGGQFDKLDTAEKLSFDSLVRAIGGTPPGPEAPLDVSGFEFHLAGTYQPTSSSSKAPAKAEAPVLNPASASSVNVAGKSGFSLGTKR